MDPAFYVAMHLGSAEVVEEIFALFKWEKALKTSDDARLLIRLKQHVKAELYFLKNQIDATISIPLPNKPISVRKLSTFIAKQGIGYVRPSFLPQSMMAEFIAAEQKILEKTMKRWASLLAEYAENNLLLSPIEVNMILLNYADFFRGIHCLIATLAHED